MWNKWNVYRNDIDALKIHLEQIAKTAGLSKKILKDYYNGTRVPHKISRPGLAVALGFAPYRYSD